MIDVNHLCPGCMSRWENPSKPCPRCGFSWEKVRKGGRELEPFTILAGRYLLGAQIGAGGFGITYIAMDLEKEQSVAVKEFFPASLAGREGLQVAALPGEEGRYFREALRGFRREAELLARFRGLPGIVPFRELTEENGTLYLVMDFVEGMTVKQYMQWTGRPFTEEQTLSLMRPVLEAVGEMHARGVLHRDISPENLICRPDGQLVLIDFGAAREYHPGEEENMTVVLKHGYAPEEQYHAGSRQGPWTDLYACCAVIYQMISGILPQDAASRGERDLLTPLDQIGGLSVSSRTAAAIRRGMDLDIEARYRTVGELIEDLYGPVPVRREPASEEAEGSRRKRRRWPLFLGIGAAAAAAAVVFLCILPGRSDPENTSAFQALEGNQQEDGSVWYQTGNISFRVDTEELPEESWTWEKSSERSTEWTFTGENAVAASSYSYVDGDSGTAALTYDEEGRILSVEDGEIFYEYTYGEASRTVTVYENGRMTAENRTDLDDSGRTVRNYSAGYDESGALTAENEESYVYEDHADGTSSLEYRMEGWEDTESGEEGSPDSYRIHNTESTTYDGQGNPLTHESRQETWNGEPGGSEDHWGFQYRSTYDNSYDEEGRLIRQIETNESRDAGGEVTETRTTNILTYDAWGNQLTLLYLYEDEDGNVVSLSFSSYLYEKFVPENGILTATGETSGTVNPEMPKMGASSSEESAGTDSSAGEEEQNVSAGILDTEDLDAELADLEMVMEKRGMILAPPEEGDLGYQGVVSGVYDAFLTELEKPLLEEEGVYREDLYYVLPPESWDYGDVVAAAACADPETAWELTQAFYEENLYDYTGSWAQLIRGLQSGETDLVFSEADRWKWPLMEQYIRYIAETEGRELALADENGTVQVRYP